MNAGAETVPTVRVGSRTLANPRGAQVVALLVPAALAGESIRYVRRCDWRVRIASWTPTLALVVVSAVIAASGHADLSWVLNGLAFAAWWLTRPLRR